MVQYHHNQGLHSQSQNPCSLHHHFHSLHYNSLTLLHSSPDLDPCLALPCWVPLEVHQLQDCLVSTVVPIQAQAEVPQGRHVLPDFPFDLAHLQEVPTPPVLEVVAKIVDQVVLLGAAGLLYS